VEVADPDGKQKSTVVAHCVDHDLQAKHSRFAFPFFNHGQPGLTTRGRWFRRVGQRAMWCNPSKQDLSAADFPDLDNRIGGLKALIWIGRAHGPSSRTPGKSAELFLRLGFIIRAHFC
jgi:hypothetical protein